MADLTRKILRRERKRTGISARQQRKALRRARLGKKFGLPKEKR
jgi:hypothetical protein